MVPGHVVGNYAWHKDRLLPGLLDQAGPQINTIEQDSTQAEHMLGVLSHCYWTPVAVMVPSGSVSKMLQHLASLSVCVIFSPFFSFFLLFSLLFFSRLFSHVQNSSTGHRDKMTK
jgi:predicted PurR-regulated permease PerM